MENLNTPAQKHTISIPPLQRGRSAARQPNPFSNHKQMTNPTERHDDQYCLQTMIAQANTAIKEDMKLKEDGSNFVTWEDNMAMLLDDFIDDADYCLQQMERTSSMRKYIDLCSSTWCRIPFVRKL
ncbi:hypothetical protein O181_071488 [Austropuccinia psidii MF-1]|uniref:Uncharacterized protein n=1 Tax=Austropuccinia psidii MF-1 TaxID=1389203 RepID=A0A9Q3I886_9BASI|nr:hypothetical protein [Austropuccinia psidii MF-1]